ncbi:hypothetical protein C8A03DRAFT_19490 [Achaetomium macrosporum]|uniref:Uncharacterized protein n=1 Tax=Achaetomium macrosporum TaxID=79813 RepID=A0AAN7H3K4_9PEZI|nr:hypothetical protein C8A03DRAFT_19490 [Achaetomium macrosporum]
MSSPAQIAGPNDRPVSKLPGTLPPPREPARAFGREPEYTETQQNPPPQVVCFGPESSAQNVLATSRFGGGDGANEGAFEHDTRSSLRPDIEGNKEPGFNDIPDIEPPELPWYRTISRGRWVAIVICLVGSTAVVLAILGAMNRLSGNNRSATPTADDSETGTQLIAEVTSTSSDSSHSADETATAINTASTSTSTTTSANPTSTIDCTNSSTFITPVTWIGTDLTYTSHFSQDSDPESCCNSCLSHDPGCAGWLYNGTTEFTPCTKIVLNGKQRNGDGDRDETCPQGYTGKTFFSMGNDGSGSVAGLGPCSRMIKIQ